MTIFPDLSPYQSGEGISELPVYREWAYDFIKNELLTRGGKYYLVEKNEALKIWIHKALDTKRYVYPAYSRNMGQEFDNLIGLTTNRQILESETKRYIQECLLANPYILDVYDFKFTYDGKALVSFNVTTVYGDDEEEMELDS